MNKQQKIIVSIVGITIVLLALLGITYAYYLTRIEGNTNTNSISITTANLKLKYEDGNGIISANNIVPGNVVGTKTFSVTNSGNTIIDDYSVSLEYAHIVKDGKVIVPSIFNSPGDFKITLTCIDNNGEDCNGNELNFNNQSVVLVTSSISPGVTHNYSLSIKYNDTGIDQSNDMGKNLNLKVQIYRLSETTDISGSIAGVDENYTVKLESEPKISSILKVGENYYYEFKGVPYGTHTLSILDNDGVLKATKKIIFEKGNSTNIDTTTIESEEVAKITTTTSDRVVNINSTINADKTVLENAGDSFSKYNPYVSNKESLAYNIINNAMNTVDGTLYVEKSLTIPGKTAAGATYNEAVTIENTTMTITETFGNYYWTYADSYSVDINAGITLNEPKTCKFKDCFKELVGKYVIPKSSYSRYNLLDYVMETTGLDEIYKIVSVGSNVTDSISYEKISLGSTEFVEKSLSTTQDEYGTSYYYRGAVDDNYINIANMCFRIVRIQGDGSIKLIMEDVDQNCEDSDGNFGIGTGVYGYELKKTVDGADYYLTNYLNSSVDGQAKAMLNFQPTLEDYFDYMKSGDWCYDDQFYDKPSSNKVLVNDPLSYINEKYATYNLTLTTFNNTYSRNLIDKEPSLVCNSRKLKTFEDDNNTLMYVGAITVDELSFAGTFDLCCSNYYLLNDYALNKFLEGNYVYYWTISPGEDHSAFAAFASLNIGIGMAHREYSYRPAIILKNNVLIDSGNGTKSSPYTIKID